MIINTTLVSLVVVYVIIGLSASAVSSVSQISVLALIVGNILILLFRRVNAKWVSIYIMINCYFAITWLYSASVEINSLIRFVTAVGGGFIVIYAYAIKLIKENALIAILIMPFIVNVVSYYLGVNLTADLLDIDKDQALARFSGLLGNSNVLATAFAMPAFVYILLVLSGRVLFGWRWTLVMLIILATAVALSGSRKSLFFILVYIIFIIFSLTKFDIRKKAATTVFVMALGVGGISLCGSGYCEFMNDLLFKIESVRRLMNAFEGDESSYISRMQYLELAPRLFLESPIIGHGLDAFRIVSGFGVYAHNNYIELLVNSGVVGFSLYYITLLLAAYRFAVRSKSLGTFIIILVMFATLDMTGVTYLDRNVQVIYVLLLFLGLSKVQSKESLNNLPSLAQPADWAERSGEAR